MGNAFKYGSVATAIVLSMLVVLVWLLPRHVLEPMALQFASSHIPKLSLSDVANLFNFTYGLPVAVVGAILGALATIVAGVFALRQGDVDILVFIESKTSPAISLYRQLVDAIGALNACGNDARRLGAQLYRQIENEGGPASSALARLLVEAPDDFDDIDRALDYIATLEDQTHVNLLAGVFLHIREVRQSLSNVADIFEAIEKDFYASFFSRRQMEAEREKPPSQPRRTPAHARQRPMSYLRSNTPSDQVSPDQLLDDLPSLAKELRYRASTNDLFAPARASAFAPGDASTIDYLGLVLAPVFLDLRFPKRFEHQGQTGTIFGYVINLGAAQLLSVAKAVPQKDTIETAFREIFPNRSRVAMNFLRKLLPERSALGPPYILGSIDPEFEDLRKLILVDELWDGQRNVVFHDPAKHGPLPQNGYRVAGEAVRTESVAHNEKGAPVKARLS